MEYASMHTAGYLILMFLVEKFEKFPWIVVLQFTITYCCALFESASTTDQVLQLQPAASRYMHSNNS